MIDIESENMNQTKIPTNGLGIRLKSAREAMSLTTKEAAAHLHLSVNIIDIIEKEQFADGPPPTFMRGYLRSYARLLNVPEHEINKTLKELEMIIPIKSTPLPVSNIRSTPQTERYLHWITYLIVLTMVILVALWWHSHQRYIISDVPTKTTTATTPSAVSDVPPITTEEAPATHTTVKPVDTTPLPATSEDKKSVTTTTVDVQSPVTDTRRPLTSEAPTAVQPSTSQNTLSPTTINPDRTTPSTVTPNNDTSTISTTPDPITDVIPPQIDMPPIVSATMAPAPPTDLNQSEAAAVKESPAPTTKPIRKHKPASRHATLPGMPGVNMALPEPN